MPELPEVECVRRGLESASLGAELVGFWRSRKKLRTGAAWRQENLRVLREVRPGAVMRRGKFLVWRFERDDGPPVGLVVHLGMTGRLVVTPADAPREPHTHLTLSFADRRDVRFVDARRFGGVRAGSLDSLESAAPLATLGVEPLTEALTGDALRVAARGSSRSIRDVLLDQRVVAGIGNIYVSEILFAAGIHPLARARRIRDTAWLRIAEETRRVLSAAVDNGGTSFRDYRNADGQPGRNQSALRAYGRAGEPCVVCNAPLEGYVHGGRSGVMCRRCQPRQPGGWVR